jgi:hypothetical protein
MTFSAWCTPSCRANQQGGTLCDVLTLVGVIRSKSGFEELPRTREDVALTRDKVWLRGKVPRSKSIFDGELLTDRQHKDTLPLANRKFAQRRMYWNDYVIPHRPLIWMRHFTMSQGIYPLRTIETCWSNFGQRSATTSNGWKLKLGNRDQTKNLSACPEPSSVVVWRHCLPPLDIHTEVKCSNLV